MSFLRLKISILIDIEKTNKISINFDRPKKKQYRSGVDLACACVNSCLACGDLKLKGTTFQMISTVCSRNPSQSYLRFTQPRSGIRFDNIH